MLNQIQSVAATLGAFVAGGAAQALLNRLARRTTRPAAVELTVPYTDEQWDADVELLTARVNSAEAAQARLRITKNGGW